jgi:SAM-dependent methyltransferase
MKRVVKRILERAGIQPEQFLFSIRKENAVKIRDEKLGKLDAATRDLILAEDECHHYGDLTIHDPGLQYVIQSFTIDRINFIRDSIGESLDLRVADLGDSNGIFIRAIGKDGISVNISDPAIIALHAQGLTVVKADIEHLPFKSGSIDTIFLFETLEHVPNPIRLLTEIERVVTRSVILSVPYVSETVVHSTNYDPTRPQYQQHIFEFSPADLKKIVTHSNFKVKDERIATVLDGGRSLRERVIFSIWQRFFERDCYWGVSNSSTCAIWKKTT